jgi:hypothetical protein
MMFSERVLPKLVAIHENVSIWTVYTGPRLRSSCIPPLMLDPKQVDAWWLLVHRGSIAFVGGENSAFEFMFIGNET